MLKSIVLGSCLFLSLLSFPTVVRSQANQLSAPNPSQVATSQDITPLEIQQFVQVLKRWQSLEVDAQKKIVEGIKAEQLTPQRFVEINDIKTKSVGADTQLSSEDLDKYQKILARIQEIEKAMKGKREQAIISQGLTVKRFNEIGYAAEQDPQMKQKVQQMLGGDGKTTPGQKPKAK